ncbi:archease [Candidatus Pacearchaeota archaeon]|nr:archease [Candidatus Pacearchaeota archaeon]
MKYKFLSNDGLKFKAYGDSIEEVFANSALAMFASMNEEDKIASTKQLKIKVKGKDMESLLYNFLEELIFLFKSQNLFLSKVRDIRLDKKSFKLIAKISGDNAKNYELKHKVKEAKYKGIIIGKENKKWVANITFDIQ